MKDKNQNRHKDKVYAGEGENTAEHKLLHHADTLQAAAVDKLKSLEYRGCTDKETGDCACGNENFILAEETVEKAWAGLSQKRPRLP